MIEVIYGAINIEFAILWAEADQVYKEISLRAVTNTANWTEHLAFEERLWLVDKVATTAILGERVAILNQQDDWLKIAIISQRTRKNQLGYPGWVLANQVSYDSTYLLEQVGLLEAVVTVAKTTLFSDSALTQPLRILSYQTRLPILAENELVRKVRLPEGEIGYLTRSETKSAMELVFSNKKMVQDAQGFLGLKYLWGGTSSDGFDCSGLMFRLYQGQGILIPRDASEQAREGVSVNKDNLQLGDLLFFAKDNNPNKIHHVGMYVGEGLMIHSPNSKSAVKIEPFETGVYGEEYWGARRYRKSSS